MKTRPFTQRETSAITSSLFGPKALDPASLVTFNRAVARLITQEAVPMLRDVAYDGVTVSEIEDWLPGITELIQDLAVCEASGSIMPRHSKAIMRRFHETPGLDLPALLRETDALAGVDSQTLLDACKTALANDQKACDEFLAGKQKAIGSLVGAVLKAVKADPKEVRDELLRLLAPPAP